MWGYRQQQSRPWRGVWASLPGVSLHDDTKAYRDAIQAGGGTISTADLVRVDKIALAVNASSTLLAAKAASKLMVAPFRGDTVAARLTCLYHPLGAGTVLTTTLADANITANGVRGDTTHTIDTRWDVDNMRLDETQLYDVCDFECQNRHSTIWLAQAGASDESGLRGNSDSSSFAMGHTYKFSNQGAVYMRKRAVNIIGWSMKNGENPLYNTFADLTLEESKNPDNTRQHIAACGNLHLLGMYNDAAGGGSAARMHTAVVTVKLTPSEYIALATAVNQCNSDRRPYAGITESSTYKVWIFAGQSNCTGQQTVRAAKNYCRWNRATDAYDDDNQHPRIFQYGRIAPRVGQIIPGTPLFHFVDTNPIGISPCLAFAKRLIELGETSNIVIVPCALGGSSFTDGKWINPTGTAYQAMIADVPAALAACGGTLAGIVWNQGEGDVSMSTGDYVTNYHNMMSGLIAAIPGGWPAGARRIIGQVANLTWNNQTKANAVIANGDADVFVTQAMAGVNVAGNADHDDDLSHVHYSGLAQRLMGKAYADAV